MKRKNIIRIITFTPMQRFLILSLLFLFSCGHSTKPVSPEPDNLIPQDKMVEIVADVHLLEATLAIRSPATKRPLNHLPQEFLRDSVSPISVEPSKKDTLPYYNIFKRHEVTQQQYESSMA